MIGVAALPVAPFLPTRVPLLGTTADDLGTGYALAGQDFSLELATLRCGRC